MMLERAGYTSVALFGGVKLDGRSFSSYSGEPCLLFYLTESLSTNSQPGTLSVFVPKLMSVSRCSKGVSAEWFWILDQIRLAVQSSVLVSDDARSGYPSKTSQIDADSICHQFVTFDEDEGVHKFGDLPRLAEPGAEVEAEQM